MVVVLCNDAEIEVPDGEVCEICGQEPGEFNEGNSTRIERIACRICEKLVIKV